MTPRPSPVNIVLTVLGAVLVAGYLLAAPPGYRPTWALALGLLAVAAWVVRAGVAATGHPRPAVVLCGVAVLAGAIAGPATDGNSVIPAGVCVLVLLADLRVPFPVGVGAGATAVVLVAAGELLHPVDPLAVMSMIGGVLLAAFAGLSRRQTLTAQRQAALLASREAAAKEQAARVAVSRDLHDVLAHTLGGLVIQLDAAEALLEADELAAARATVAGARALAVTGLSEARGAVTALRAPAARPAADVESAEFEASLRELVMAHGRLGGSATFDTAGEPRTLSGAQATAFERALQEALSNARRHAAGMPVRVELEWQDDRVRLSVCNDLPAAVPAGSGGVSGGYGLIGMKERFETLPRGGSVSAGASGGRFVLTAEAGAS